MSSSDLRTPFEHERESVEGRFGFNNPVRIKQFSRSPDHLMEFGIGVQRRPTTGPQILKHDTTTFRHVPFVGIQMFKEPITICHFEYRHHFQAPTTEPTISRKAATRSCSESFIV